MILAMGVMCSIMSAVGIFLAIAWSWECQSRRDWMNECVKWNKKACERMEAFVELERMTDKAVCSWNDYINADWERNWNATEGIEAWSKIMKEREVLSAAMDALEKRHELWAEELANDLAKFTD